MDLKTYKISSALVLGVVALAGAVLSKFISEFDPKYMRVSNAASGGVLLSVAISHMLSEASGEAKEWGDVFASWFAGSGQEDGGEPYEWGAIFNVAGETSLTWTAQQKNGVYEQPGMKMVLLPAANATEEMLESIESKADASFDQECVEAEPNSVLSPAENTCYHLHFEGGPTTTFTVALSNLNALAIFTEHHPDEFEYDTHYLKDSAGHDLEPAATLGAEGGEHNHERRLSQARRLHSHGGEAPSFPMGFVLCGMGYLTIVSMEVLGGGGHEHGHHDHGEGCSGSSSEDASNDELKAVNVEGKTFGRGVAAAAGVGLHAIVEGTAAGASGDASTFGMLFFAIIAHKGFAGFSVGSLLFGTIGKAGWWALVLIFASATPLGIFIGMSLEASLEGPACACLICFAAGSLLCIAVNDMISPALLHGEGDWKKRSLLACVVCYFAMSLLALWA